MSGGKVSSLRDLPPEVSPARDLWPELESKLREEEIGPRGHGGYWGHWRRGGHRGPRARRGLAAVLRPLAAVAVLVAAVAVGIAIDRGLLSASHVQRSVAARGSGPEAVPAYFADPSYTRERETLLRSLDARLATLPPQSRQKVLASLATLDQSIREIQAALGREPGDGLLQELLIDTYQDEMQVLTTVQEASAGGET